MAKSASDIVDRALTLMDEVPTTFATAATTETSIRTMALEILPDLCRDLIKEFPWELKRYLATDHIPIVSYNVSAQGTSPRGLAIYNDKLYLIDDNADSLSRYTINSDGSITYDDVSISLIGLDASPFGITIYNDKLFISGEQNDSIYRYAINSVGDLTYETTISIAAQTPVPKGLAAYNNKLYLSGNTVSGNNHTIYRYDIDVSGNLTYDGYSVNVSQRVPNFAGLSIKDGKLFMNNYINKNIYRYSIDGNGDLTYDNYQFNVSDIDSTSSGIDFLGNNVYLSGSENDSVYKLSIIDSEFTLIEYDDLINGESQSTYVKKKVGIKAPSDFWELVSIRLTVWAKPVTDYILINGEEYPRQNNPFTRSGKQNPSVALNNTSLGGNARIECFSIENGDASTVANFQYVSFNNVPDDSGNTWPDETFDEVTKALAAQLNMIKSRFDEGTIMSSEIEGAIEQHE